MFMLLSIFLAVAVIMHNDKVVKVIHKGDLQANNLKADFGDWKVTIFVGVNAAGMALPPLLIISGKSEDEFKTMENGGLFFSLNSSSFLPLHI